MRKVLYILGQLDDKDIEWLAQAGRSVSYGDGEALIVEGNVVPDLFIVMDGQVNVHVAGIGTIATLGSGEILGEMSFVDKAPPSATVRSAGQSQVLAIAKDRMEERLRTNPGFAGRFYKALSIFLADRLRGTVARQKTGTGLKPGTIEEDELDEAVLDGISMAGIRFQHMLTTLRGKGSLPR